MTADQLRARITTLKARLRDPAQSPVRTPAQDAVTLELAAAVEALWDLEHPDVAAPPPDVDAALGRVRRRAGLEKARGDLQGRLAGLPEGAPAAGPIITDLLAIRSALTEMDHAEGAA